MARARRVRWECPNGLHPGQLGSTRPKAEATVRFCWPCSEEAGVLVRRVAPALERKRGLRAATVAQQQAAKREREREQKARAMLVSVRDFDGSMVELDAGVLLKRAWKSRELQRRLAESWRRPGRLPVPELELRRGNPDKRPAHQRIDRSGDISAHAFGADRITMTCGPALGREWLEAIIVHEAAHCACPDDAWHDGRWASSYVRAIRELYGVRVDVVRPTWQLDANVAAALRGRAV